jgi:hypothetical protein
MRAVLVQALLGVMAVAAGCTDNGIGRKCLQPVDQNGMPVAITGTAVSSPALECPTRLCLLYGQGTSIDRSVCTASCTVNDDCASATISAAGTSDGTCTTKFVCAVATVTGGDAIKCKKFCVCQDDLKCGFNKDENGAPITPPSCPNPSPTPNCP